jgi:quinol-cytochrome oxidoreductase complex cytochrome b subunit
MNRTPASHRPWSDTSWYRRAARRLVVTLVILGCLVFTPSLALAAKKKKEEEAPTKSYVGAYMIVMMMVSVGLMTVCRPGKRKDRPDEKKAGDE